MSTVSISPVALTFNNAASEVSPIRLMLSQRESISVQLRAGHDLVRVVSGCAWISHEGKDFVLKAGEQEQLYRGRFDTLITALGKRTLVVELLPAVTA
ncbi:MAG: DUF2917 domain-containing protein [Anaerolineae bacterium]|nr:DUF2917 domain-containing protein [Anaerolineae bacterium]